MGKQVKTKTIKQTATFKALPHEIYEMLMDSKLHSKFTEAKANISRKVGGKFTAYDGYIQGKNLELVKDRKIVQAWREPDFPKNHWSTVTYLLSRNGNGTKLSFTHSGVPLSEYKDIKKGWREFYWEKIKAQLEK